jgi:hypothetical protein
VRAVPTGKIVPAVSRSQTIDLTRINAFMPDAGE